VDAKRLIPVVDRYKVRVQYTLSHWYLVLVCFFPSGGGSVSAKSEPVDLARSECVEFVGTRGVAEPSFEVDRGVHRGLIDFPEEM